MNNNEMMNEGMETMVEEVVADNGKGLGVGGIALIVAGACVAVCAGAALAKKVYSAHKAKKSLNQPEMETMVEPEDLEEVAAK